ncbi:hypothetical protein GAO09_27450 [Rhizobiales bacterium RZME27]|uniref:Knr4/Smi1-like domain-containing protein n=1 Tax=Endobacterium cereale TaxID=2663029 RepID=A0A6A8AIS7_9HYPH|nr:SMI1/KNR4 family protein [Endobacterium cereale]MEB2842976.1 SMI1/KNR4 family protein [Endobacterium cereale]MQY49768.1 hypothetical protein [Endobacterium cereale]
MTATDAETPAEMLIRRADELRQAAEAAQTYGECLRLNILLSEARSAYWARSEKDFDDRNFMWSEEIFATDRSIRAQTETLRPMDEIPAILETTEPTVESFFDSHCRPPSTLDEESRKRRIDLIDAAEKRLGIAINGTLRALFAHCNGGTTDFYLHPRFPWSRVDYTNVENHPDDGHKYSPFYTEWQWVFDDQTIASVQHWQSVESFMAEEIDRYQREDYIVDLTWREKMAGLDRLIILCMQENSRTWDINMTCLDFRRGPLPGLVILAADKTGEHFEIRQSWPSFETLFGRLRRWSIREIDGAVRKRGPTYVEIFDEGRWRMPYG